MKPRGNAGATRKLPPVDELTQIFNEGFTNAELAKRFNVSINAIAKHRKAILGHCTKIPNAVEEEVAQPAPSPVLREDETKFINSLGVSLPRLKSLQGLGKWKSTRELSSTQS